MNMDDLQAPLSNNSSPRIQGKVTECSAMLQLHRSQSVAQWGVGQTALAAATPQYNTNMVDRQTTQENRAQQGRARARKHNPNDPEVGNTQIAGLPTHRSL